MRLAGAPTTASQGRAGSELAELYGTLRGWLLTQAYPRWWSDGADFVRDGFHERLHPDATPTGEARRARLHPRQIFAYAQASKLGWQGPASQAVAHGMDYFLARYRRSDGLYRTRVAADGTALEDEAVLYDQAFALLGFASAQSMSADSSAQKLAYDLHDRLQSAFGRAGGGFETTERRELPLASNPHMHLLEASLYWCEIDTHPRWRKLAAGIVELALTRLFDSRSGAIGEFFGADWSPTPTHGYVVEPGHQFEWAWLLLGATRHWMDPRLTPTALRLIGFGETFGVDRQRRVAIQQCFDDGKPIDMAARLWAQTERIKAACIAAEFTGDARYFDLALEAARALMPYLDAPSPGLWRDRLNPDGRFVDEPAPASSLYHIVGAVAELGRALGSPKY